ncbi:MAG: thiamine diphosphokinase [Alistipes sp.]|nr:thiamine diphosphokinase [Alistipes sp.]
MLKQSQIEAVILANGDYPSAELPLQILLQGRYVVCCDGGADHYIAKGYTPDAIIGDGDSLSEENRRRFADIIHYSPDQETNDQTKAVRFLLEKGIRHIAIVGATGKRDDHTLGNIALLAEYRRMGADVRSYTDYGVFIPCSGECRVECKKGAQVSIFNINANSLTSKGLRYPIYDFSQWWQGTLNEAVEGHFSISGNGDYIVYVTYSAKE